MTAPQTSTALMRILALSLAGGALSACDYASRLPDAPTTLGYEIESRKPPSVTGTQTLPPPQRDLRQTGVERPEGIEVPNKLPIEQVPEGLRELAMAPNSSLSRPAPAPAPMVAPPPAPVPAPQSFETAMLDPAMPAYQPMAEAPVAPITGEPRIGTVGTPPGEFITALPDAPMIGDSSPSYARYEPVPFDALEPQVAYDGSSAYVDTTAPVGYSEGGSYEIAAAPAEMVPDVPILDYSPDYAAPAPRVSRMQPIYDGPNAPKPDTSPIQVTAIRLANGAVVRVHPVIGAPMHSSRTLARTIANELGSPASAAAISSAVALFDLRAEADAGGAAAADWRLYDRRGNVVGVFSEAHAGSEWAALDDVALESIARRVADRLRRNSDLRRATLNAISSVPTPMIGKAPAEAPYPPRHPKRAPQIRIAAPAPAPVISNPEPLAPLRIVPLPRPAPIVAQPVPAPVETVAIAPTPRIAPAPIQPMAPVVSAPAPSFETLRPEPRIQTAQPVPVAQPLPVQPVQAQPVGGPRSVVFRGVRGAPGDGNEALSREVGRLLSQSGVQMTSQPSPSALFLTGKVDVQRTGAEDRVRITWFVEDAQGQQFEKVAVQENSVPPGSLDGRWGQDAYYAADGARSQIMAILRDAGASGS